MPPHPSLNASVRAFIFDAYGTLFDVHSAVMAHAGQIGPQAQALSDVWRVKQLEYSWVLSLAGQWRDFFLLTSDALDFALARFPSVDPALRAPLLQAYRTLAAYSEAQAVLTRLRAGGYRTGILSNGERGMLDDAVASAGLGPLLDAVWSADQAQIFKPDRRVYEMATGGFGLQPHEICLVSSNRWDVAGATAFGMPTIWVNRSAQPPEYDALAPVATVADLNGVG